MKNPLPLAAVLGIGLVMFFSYGRIDYESPPYSYWDLYFYRHMAAAAPALDLDIRQPFCYRLLGPWLVALVPLPVPQAFYLSSSLASLALLAVLFGFLRTLEIPPIA